MCLIFFKLRVRLGKFDPGQGQKSASHYSHSYTGDSSIPRYYEVGRCNRNPMRCTLRVVKHLASALSPRERVCHGPVSRRLDSRRQRCYDEFRRKCGDGVKFVLLVVIGLSRVARRTIQCSLPFKVQGLDGVRSRNFVHPHNDAPDGKICIYKGHRWRSVVFVDLAEHYSSFFAAMPITETRKNGRHVCVAPYDGNCFR